MNRERSYFSWTRLNNTLCAKLGAKRVGNNIILSIKPKIMIGPHWPGVLVTICVLLGGTWINLSILNIKKYSDIARYTLEILIFFLFSSTLVFLILTSCSDPGIVVKDNVYCEYDLIESRTDDDFENDEQTHDKNKFHKSRNLYDTSYCDVCQIYQYNEHHIRHCDDCGVCILGHDHHCPWMGKCVGKKNMTWFIIFNISWIIYVIELLIVAWT